MMYVRRTWMAVLLIALLLAACAPAAAPSPTAPTAKPAAQPTAAPTAVPAAQPTVAPTTAPAAAATAPATKPTSAPTAAQAAFPVTIQHKYGSTTIPAEPRRVVTVGFNEQDFVLALGVTPVGVREWLGGYAFQSRPWARSAMGGAELPTVGGNELDFERIAALRPDLILGLYAFLKADAYDKLSGIAPTVVQPAQYGDGAIPWQQQQLLTGRALGREARAKEIVAAVEARFEQARAAYPDFAGKTAAFVSFNAEGFWIFKPDDIRTQFLTALGFKLPEETGPLSHERAKALEQDVVIAVTKREVFENDPLYGQLDVVREGRVVYLADWTDHLAAAIGFNSPLSLQYLLDGMVPRLAAALDGDPSTKTDAPAQP